MNKKFRFFFYVEAIRASYFIYISIVDYVHSGIFSEITKSSENYINILDFIGVEIDDMESLDYCVELLEEAIIQAYERKKGENLHLILTNMRENLAHKITHSKKLELYLSKHQYVIPVFDSYSRLYFLLGLPDQAQNEMKMIMDYPIHYNLSTAILDANPWFFIKKNTSYVASFSIQDLIKNLTAHIIKNEIRAWQEGHIQILDYHVLECVTPFNLFSKPYFNAWWARVIYSQFWNKNIDVIVYDSMSSAKLAFEVKKEFLKTNSDIKDLLIDTYENIYRKKNDEKLRKQLENKNILIVTDVVITGESLIGVCNYTAQCNGIIKGIATVFKNNRIRFNNLLDVQLYSLTEFPIDLYSVNEKSTDQKCPECNKTNGKPLKYFHPKTNNLFKLSSTKDDYMEVLSGRSENESFWNMVKESQALYPHILNKNDGTHHYYYINTSDLLNQFDIDNMDDWDITSLYKDLRMPDTILFMNDSLSFLVVNKLITRNKSLQKATLLPIDKKDTHHRDLLNEKLKDKNILIVLNTIESGHILNRLLYLCRNFNVDLERNVRIFIVIDRSPPDYRKGMAKQIAGPKIKSIYKVPIPTFKYEREDCPICREIDILMKYYDEFSYNTKRYVDQRLEVLTPIEIDPEKDSVIQDIEKTYLNDAIIRGRSLNFLYERGDTAFFEIFKHRISVEKLFRVLEAVPKEYMDMYDIQTWLSEQIEQTNNIEHLTKLLQTAIQFAPSMIKNHLEKVTNIFLTPENIGYLGYLFEYLICEGVVSKKDFVEPLLIKIGKEISDKYYDIYKEFKNFVLNVYPEEIANHPSLSDMFNEIIRRAANTDANILITGETGTGKERIAELIHNMSDRRYKPFIPVDTSSVPETLIESELFGHEKGAFTGAIRRYEGKLKQADGGTLFLDEISNVSLNIQAKLLRVLQDDDKDPYKKFNRLGGKDIVRSDFRLICASNIPIEDLMKTGVFRKDLYYRINVIRIHIPSLKETPQDIPILAKIFLEKSCSRHKKKLIEYNTKTERFLHSYSSSWDGNVRELKNIIERLVILSDKGKPNYDLIMKMVSKEKPSSRRHKSITKEDIMSALEKTKWEKRWNKKKASELLNCSRPWLDKKMKNYSIPKRPV